MTPDFAAARDVVLTGLEARAFPAATVEVGSRSGPVWREAFGRLSYAAGSRPTDLETVFDLASLTKVIATASVAMRQVAHSTLSLDDHIATHVPGWRLTAATIRHLLDHSSGLPSHARLWPDHQGRWAFERAIVSMESEYEPGTRSLYSDLGFILLGLVLERAGCATLDQLSRFVEAPPGEILTFRPPAELRDRIAPTERDAWRDRELVGEVHDENAAALGGVAGHAGLFGTVGAVGAFARLVLETFQRDTALGPPQLMRRFAAQTGVPGSSRALAWDTMLPTSSCGTRMSPTAIGHVGFTGTSLWIDWERDLYVVWLTNRVHPSRDNPKLAELRPTFHNAVVEATDE